MTEKELNKINLKIAKGLGWKNLSKEKLNYKDSNLTFLNKERWIGIAPGNERKQYVPHYTNNFFYAWKIVEWLNQNTCVFHYQTMRGGKRGHFTSIGFLTHPYSSLHDNIYAEGPTPQQAICNAFIKYLDKKWITTSRS